MKLKLLPPTLVCALAMLAGDQGATAMAPVRKTTKRLPKAKKTKKTIPVKKTKGAPKPKPKKAGPPAPIKKTKPVLPGKKRKQVCTRTKPPSPKECLTKAFGEGPCYHKFKKHCAPHWKVAFDAHYEKSSKPETKMLQPKGSDIPENLKKGKSFPYPGPKPGKSVRSTGGTVFAQSGLTSVPRPATVNTAKNAHRNKNWENNGQKIATCEEYAYENYYDFMRFEDAAAACKGNKRCVFDVAYLPGNPGIANRTLKRRDGKPLAIAHQYRLTKMGRVPKNLFFALGPRFVYAGDGKTTIAETPSLKAMAAAQAAGEEYYSYGCGGKKTCGKNQFRTEWAWHSRMNQINRHNKKMSDGEFQEYDRRRAELARLYAEWGVAVRKEKEELLSKIPPDFHRWEDPLTHVMDPVQQLVLVRDLDKMATQAGKQFLRTAPKNFVKQIKSMGGGINTRGINPQTTGGPHSYLEPQFQEVEEFAPVGVLAAPKTRRKPTSRRKPRLPSPSTMTCSKRNFGNKVSELMGIGPISCKIGRLMRAEWARKERSQVSCLDLGRTECDWSPTYFEQRVLRSVPVAPDLAKDQQWCSDWISGGKFNKPVPPNLTEARKIIFGEEQAWRKAMKVMYPYAMGQGMEGKKFGASLKDQDHFGDKDWFAAGYNYDLGWEVEPTKRNGDSQVCKLGGQAHADFGVDAWVLDDDTPLEIVDGLFRGRVNYKGSNNSQIKAHLRVFSKELFGPVNETFSHAWNRPIPFKNIRIPTGYKPSFTFMAGPIPITGAGWGELMTGTIVGVEGKINSACSGPTDIEFRVDGNVEPFIAVNGRAQVGIGISGIVSAGVRGMLNLVTLGVPVDVGIFAKNINSGQGAKLARLGFDLGIGLTLATLSGYLSLYIEFLLYEEEWKLFSWNGLGPEKISLLGPLEESMPLSGF